MDSISYTKAFAESDWIKVSLENKFATDKDIDELYDDDPATPEISDYSSNESPVYSLTIPGTEHNFGSKFIALTLVFIGGEYIYSNGVLGNIKFSYTIVGDDLVISSNKPFAGKTIITEGVTEIEPDVNYPLQYTGDEIDQALGRLLGTFYGDESSPGCQLVGRESYNPVNLNEVDVPGLYTAYYYNHGPSELNDYNGTSPIRMHVYVDEDFQYTGRTAMWQTITALSYSEADESTGQEAGEQLYLFYRDLNSADIDNASSDYGWAKMKLSTGATVIVNNLRTPNPNIALSANTGYYLKYLIDNDEIGSVNMLSNTGFTRDNTGWLIDKDASIVPIEESVLDFYGKKRNCVIIPPTTSTSAPVRGISIDQSKLPNINGSERDITLSFYVKTTPGVNIFAMIQLVDSQKNYLSLQEEIIENDFESDESGVYMTTVSSFVEKTVTVSDGSAIHRVSVTLNRADIFFSKHDAREVAIYFGVRGTTNNSATFYLPQLEVGRHATSWHMNWYDMWNEFDNARNINEIPVTQQMNINTIKNQQTLVFNDAEKQFIARYIATGGGGGFVAQDTPPSETELLWYCTKTGVTGGKLYLQANFYAYIDDSWSQLSYKVIQSITEPNDTTTLWINTNPNESLSGCRPYSETEPPDLCYYDTIYKKWRVVGAAPRPSFIIQEAEPKESDRDLMWIHPVTWIARVYYNNNWYPIQAVWGARNA